MQQRLLLIFKRVLLIVFVISAYLSGIRPARALLMKHLPSEALLQKLSSAGIQASDKIPEKRSFSTKASKTTYSFRAPLDSYFILGITFAIAFGVPIKWLFLTTVVHLVLWAASFVLLRLSVHHTLLLAAMDGFSTYVSPVASLGVVPLWKMKKTWH